MKDETKKKDSLEIDAFDLIEGKMLVVGLERLHKQICSK
jgi:hypothetical protein